MKLVTEISIYNHIVYQKNKLLCQTKLYSFQNGMSFRVKVVLFRISGGRVGRSNIKPRIIRWKIWYRGEL